VGCEFRYIALGFIFDRNTATRSDDLDIVDIIPSNARLVLNEQGS
jgi:hypothetical protein